MIIEQIPVGHLQTNCYLVADREGGESIAIDPGAEADKILAVAGRKKINIVKIFNTHGHWDHIGAAADLAAACAADVLIHGDDAEMLNDPMRNLSLAATFAEFRIKPNAVLTDGQTIEIGGLTIRVIHTPGHTPGSSSFLIGDNLFCGDLIFYESVGRTDLPGSDESKLHESIHAKVMTLPDDVTLYPGHGPKTSVGWEREHNPYMTAGW